MDLTLTGHTTPLVVKKTMCAYLSIGWDKILVQYKSGVRAAKKRALDASAFTVPRKWQRRDGEEEDGDWDAPDVAFLKSIRSFLT